MCYNICISDTIGVSIGGAYEYLATYKWTHTHVMYEICMCNVYVYESHVKMHD